MEDSDDIAESGEGEVNIAEWTKGDKKPLVCSWLALKKPQPTENAYSFDTAKCDRIFDLLLQQKLIRVSEGHVIPSADELKRRKYCKWHHLFSHNTNNCNIFRQKIQSAIEEGRLRLCNILKLQSWNFLKKRG